MKLSSIFYRVRNDCLFLRVRMAPDDKQRGLSQHTTVPDRIRCSGRGGNILLSHSFVSLPSPPRTSFTAPQVAEVYWRCLNSSTVTVFLGYAKGRDNANPYDMKRKWDFFLSVAFFSD